MLACSGACSGRATERNYSAHTSDSSASHDSSLSAQIPPMREQAEAAAGPTAGFGTARSVPELVALRGPALTAHGEPAAVVFAADGTRLYLGGGPAGASLQEWDVRGGTVVGGFPGGSRKVSALALSPDGALLASCDVSREILVWEVSSRAIKWRLSGANESIYSLAWAPDGAGLVALDADGHTLYWALANSSKPTLIGTGAEPTGGLSVARDGQVIVTGASGGGISLITRGTHASSRKITGGVVTHVETGRDGRTVYAAARKDHVIRAYAVNSGRLVGTFAGHSDTVNALATTPDGGRLLSASGDGTVRVWSARTGAVLAVLSADGSPAWRSPAWWSVDVSSDGSLVAAAGNGRTVGLWRLDTYRPAHGPPASGHRDAVTSLAWSPDGRRLASGGLDGRILVRAARDGSADTPLTSAGGRVESLAFAPGSGELISVADGRASRWEPSSGRALGHFSIGRGVALTHAPNGRYLATSDASRVVQIRDPKSGRVLRKLGSNKGLGQNLMRPTSVSFAPDSTRVATARWDEKVRIYKISTGRLMRELDGFLNVAWSPTGRVLATSYGQVHKRAYDVRVRLWDAETWRVIGESDAPNGVRFMPDGRHFLGVFDDGREVAVWRIEAGTRALRRLSIRARVDGHTVAAMAISPDGTRLATGGRDGSLRIWDISGL